MNDRIIRWPEVSARTSLSRTTAWRLMRDGKFPASVPITDHIVGWRLSEVDAWIAGRFGKAA